MTRVSFHAPSLVLPEVNELRLADRLYVLPSWVVETRHPVLSLYPRCLDDGPNLGGPSHRTACSDQDQERRNPVNRPKPIEVVFPKRTVSQED